jgi:hypothetical protein
MSHLQVDSISSMGGGHVDGAGKVVQVVQAESTTRVEITTSAGTWIDCGAVLNITPTFSNSKVYLSNSATGIAHAVIDVGVALRLLRRVSNGGWDAVIYRARQAYFGGELGNYAAIHYGIEYLDSPNTTLPTEYKIQIQVNKAGSNVRYNDVDNELSPRTSTSTLIATEIAQ